MVDPVVLGRVVAAYGVNGWLKIRAYSSDPLALLEYPEWFLKSEHASEWVAHRFVEGRVHGMLLVAAISGVATREAAASLRNFEIAVPRAALPATAPDELYGSDLVGLAVVNREDEVLGQVVGVMGNGAHPILRVAREGEPGERLVPFVPAYVDRVNVQAKRIDVDWRKDY